MHPYFIPRWLGKSALDQGLITQEGYNKLLAGEVVEVCGVPCALFTSAQWLSSTHHATT